jgi:hypothetical protein
VQRFGTQAALWAGLVTAALGLPLLVAPDLWAVLIGMVLMGVDADKLQLVTDGRFEARVCEGRVDGARRPGVAPAMSWFTSISGAMTS